MQKRLKGLLALLMASMLLIGMASFTASAATEHPFEELSITTEMYAGDFIDSRCGKAFYVVKKGLASDGVSPYYYYSERMNTTQNGANTAAFSTSEAAKQSLTNPEIQPDGYIFHYETFTLPDNTDGYYKYNVTAMEAYADAGYTGDIKYYINDPGGYNIVERATYVLVVEEVPCSFNISFNANGGEGSMPNYSGTYDPDNCKLPANQFTRKGYTFEGWVSSNGGLWYNNEQNYIPKSNGENITLNAVWSQKSYTVEFYEDSDSTEPCQVKTNVKWSGNVLDDVVNPGKKGYTLEGWYFGDKKVTSDMTCGDLDSNDTLGTIRLTAKWSENSNYTIKFYNDHDALTNDEAPYKIKENVKWTGNVLENVVNPEKEGSTFDGWYFDDKKVTSENTFADLASSTVNVTGIKIYAKWIENGNYIIEFDTRGGSVIEPKTNVNWSDTVLDGVKTPELSGYDFDGWFYFGNDVTSETTCADLNPEKVGDTITLTAKWVEKSGYTVKFNTDGGSKVAPKTNLMWESIVLDGVKTPEKKGYEFLGWYCGIDVVSEYTTYSLLVGSDSIKCVEVKARWKDIENPVISGIDNGETYCDGKTFTVSDNGGIASVTANGKVLTPDASGNYVLESANGEVTVVATDLAGNTATVTVTVNDHHYCIGRCKVCGQDDPNACCLVRILRYIIDWLTAFIKSCCLWLKEAPVSVGNWINGVFSCFTTIY